MFSDAMSSETANADNSLSRYKHLVIYNNLFDLSLHIELTTLLNCRAYYHLARLKKLVSVSEKVAGLK